MKVSNQQKPLWALRVAQLRQSLKMNQADFAKAVGVGQGTISVWEKGTHRPTPDAFVRIAALGEMTDQFFFLEQAGLPKKYFIGGIEKDLPSEMVAAADAVVNRVMQPDAKKSSTVRTKVSRVPIVAVTAAGGPGWINDPEYQTGEIVLPRGFLPITAGTVAISVKGDSMEPRIPDGTVVFVDSNRTRIQDCLGKIVAAWHERDGVVVKRLLSRNGTLLLASENIAYAPMEFEGWSISGVVRWVIGEAD